jgi:hypothetical protein
VIAYSEIGFWKSCMFIAGSIVTAEYEARKQQTVQLSEFSLQS